MSAKKTSPGTRNQVKPVKVLLSVGGAHLGMMGLAPGAPEVQLRSRLYYHWSLYHQVVTSQQAQLKEFFTSDEWDLLFSELGRVRWDAQGIADNQMLEMMKQCAVSHGHPVNLETLLAKLEGLTQAQRVGLICLVEDKVSPPVFTGVNHYSKVRRDRFQIFFNDEVRAHLRHTEEGAYARASDRALDRLSLVFNQEGPAVRRDFSQEQWVFLKTLVKGVAWNAQNVRNGVLWLCQVAPDSVFEQAGLDRKKLETRLFRLSPVRQICLVHALELENWQSSKEEPAQGTGELG